MAQFNSYIDNIDTDFWQNLCKNRGQLRRYEKGVEMYFSTFVETIVNSIV